MEDRRRVRRNLTYFGGRIAFNHRQSTMGCLIKNLSNNGAKLVFEAYANPPGEFDITISRTGESFRAHIVWTNEKEAGVKLLGPLADNIVSIDSALKIRRLEAERDALAKRIAEMAYHS